MKILKYLLFLFLIFAIGGFVYFGTKDGNFEISENKIIDAPSEVIFNIVKDHKNWQSWSPWIEIDPNMKVSYTENTIGVGASYSWQSENIEIGNGSVETLRVIQNKEMKQEITLETPFGDSKSDLYWYFEDTEFLGQSNVIWGIKGEYSFMEKVFMPFQEKDLKKDIQTMFQKGLTNLEEVVLQEMDKFNISIEGVDLFPGGFYMYHTKITTKSELQKEIPHLFEKVSTEMMNNNIPITGRPFIIYNNPSTEAGDVSFSACIPTDKMIVTPIGNSVLCKDIRPLTALKVVLKGNRVYLEEAYAKANEYLKTNQLTIDPAIQRIEVYPSDDEKILNPAEWITEIYIPIIPVDNELNN